MPVLTVISRGPEEAERPARITAHLKRQNTIAYTDHTETQYWVDTLADGRALGPALRVAELHKAWMTE